MLEQPPICRHWAKIQFCAYGDTCKYAHPGAAVEEDTSLSVADRRRRAWLKAQEEAANSKDGNSKQETSKDREKRKWVKNGRRGACFARWLLDKFGVELLKHGRTTNIDQGGSVRDSNQNVDSARSNFIESCTGIVDVAGGKGDLSFELHTLRGLPCTVVDPRPPNYNKLLSRYEPSRRGKSIDCAPLLTDVHMRSLTSTSTSTTTHASASTSTYIPASVPTSKCFAASSTTRAAASTHLIKWGYHVFEATLPTSVPFCFPDTLSAFEDGGTSVLKRTMGCSFSEPSDSEALYFLQTLQNCSVLIGLHSDQATEPIVDFALRYNKPFAVVPCCVFPNLRKRELSRQEFCSVLECCAFVSHLCCATSVCEKHSHQHECIGDPISVVKTEVRTHEQFCDYLARKDPRIRTELIDFEGRNTVLYML